VSGPRRYFADWANLLSNWTEQTRGASELIELEDIYYQPPEDRVKPIASDDAQPLFEVVLHASALPDSQFIISGFALYLAKYPSIINLNSLMLLNNSILREMRPL